MKFAICNRWTRNVQFEAEINCGDDASWGIKVGLAVKWAFESDAVLRDAFLSGAFLSGAVLRGADLRGADLSGAVLRDAVLSGAFLRDAVLRGADLRGADLRGADLRGALLRDALLRDAVLRGAVLRGADLRGADLRGADLRGADLRGALLRDALLRDAVLRGAVLRGADLRGAVLSDAALSDAALSDARNDLWDVLLRARHEVPGLLRALRNGRIHGTAYQGECACLVGTIANVRGVGYRQLGNGLEPRADRPAERLFLGITRGDTPETSPLAKIVEGWLVEFLALTSDAGRDPSQPAEIT